MAKASSDGVEDLHQPTFSFTRRQRPRLRPCTRPCSPSMATVVSQVEPDTKTRLLSTQDERRGSRSGLRGMFVRNKSDKSGRHTTEPSPNATLPKTSTKKGKNHNATKTPKPNITPAKQTTKPSRINVITKPTKQNTIQVTPVTHAPSKPANQVPRASVSWDPLPLFQAYPQAIKQANLSASVLSADTIIRMSRHKRNTSVRDGLAQLDRKLTNPTRPEDLKEPSLSGVKKPEKAPKMRHRGQVSDTIMKAEWTNKIFILLSSGYLLQYAGSGPFDRLPEKMMQLGKDSVAFASDAIPGRHWVLQVSQAMDAAGVPAADSRSLLSRLTFRGADYKRAATSLLLVLNSAQEMDSWIAAVRREIEAFGGKKNVSETGKPKPDDNVLQSKSQSSHRFLLQRHSDKDPDRDTDHGASPSRSPMPSWDSQEFPTAEHDHFDRLSEDSSLAFDRSGSATTVRPSTGRRSFANSIISQDGHQLDSLHSSQNRFSFMSSGQRTLITSQGTSPNLSPTLVPHDECRTKTPTEDVRPRPSAAAIHERNRSMHNTPVLSLDLQDTSLNYRQLNQGGCARLSQNHSLHATGQSFLGQRYSAIRSLDLQEPPPVPTIPTVNMQQHAKNARDAGAPHFITSPWPSLTRLQDSSSTERMLEASRTPDLAGSSVSPSLLECQPQDMNLVTSPTWEAIKAATALLESEYPRSRQKNMRRASEHLPKAPTRPVPHPPNTAHSLPTDLRAPLRSTSYASDDHNHNHHHDAPLDDIDLVRIKPSHRNSLINSTPPHKMRRISTSGGMSTTTMIAPMKPNPITVLPVSQPQAYSTPTRPFSFPEKRGTAPPPQRFRKNTINSPPFTIKPSHERLRNYSLDHRRSSPLLVNGPPPAPPPSCALPPLPPSGSSSRKGSTCIEFFDVRNGTPESRRGYGPPELMGNGLVISA